MTYHTKCMKCGKTAEIVARESDHDEDVFDIQIVCKDKHCGATASNLVTRESFFLDE